MHNIYPHEVDLLISGPNFGRNTSAAFSLSSGTIGAALSATLSGVRSIALSYGIVTHPTPTSYDEPAHKLSAGIINHLWNNWGDDEVLYNVNIPMIQALLDEDGLKIYWTSIWRNHYGRLFKETSAPQSSTAVELKQELFKGTDAEAETNNVVNVGTGSQEERKKLVFKFSPNFEGILKPQSAPSGSDGWAFSQGAASVTALHATFAERQGKEFANVQDRIWKMKL